MEHRQDYGFVLPILVRHNRPLERFERLCDRGGVVATLPAPVRAVPDVREPAGLLGGRAERADRQLPVAPELAGLLPTGLRRGSVLSVQGSAGLLLALLADASAGGAWCALVGLPAIGVLAAADLGVDLTRLALVPEPGPAWLSVTAALVDTFDLVVLAPPATAAPSEVRRLAARVRERGAVLVVDGSWPGAEVGLQVLQARWEGMGSGHGRLTGYELEVQSQGRGAAHRPRRALLRLDRAGPVPALPLCGVAESDQHPAA